MHITIIDQLELKHTADTEHRAYYSVSLNTEMGVSRPTFSDFISTL